jgi:hypothetical protein
MRRVVGFVLVASLLACGGDDELVNQVQVSQREDQAPPEAPDEEQPVTPVTPEPEPEPEPVPVGPSGEVEGLLESAEQASLDAGGNLWVVSNSALYVMPVGDSKFQRVTRETGLRDWPVRSVEGGAPGKAYVGYEGVFGPDPLTDPEWMKRSGDMDEVTLSADGALDFYRYDLHNSNTPETGKYDETRIILRIVYVESGPRAGEVYVGSSHGVTRVVGELYADHRHPETRVPNADGTSSLRYGEMLGVAVTPEGDLLVGNKYKLGRAAYYPVLDDWWRGEKNPWTWAAKGFDVDEITPIRTSGIAITSDGTAYFASYGLGVVVLAPTGPFVFTPLDVPDALVTDIVADPDGTIWIGSDSGLDRYDPAGGSFTRYGSPQGLPGGGVQHLDLSTSAVPRALVVTAGGEVGIYRGE